MTRAEAARLLESVAKELDLVVFALERPGPDDPKRARVERQRVRSELEALRDRLIELGRAME